MSVLNDASLYNKLRELQNTKAKPVVWNWKAEFIVNNKIYAVQNVVSLDQFMDFDKNHTDVVFLQINIQPSLYSEVLIPNKEKLQLKLTKELQSNQRSNDKPNKSFSWQYNAFLTESASPHVMSNERDVDDNTSNDLSNIIKITVQLVDRNFYEFRLHENAGVFRGKNTVNDIIIGLLSQPLKTNGMKGLNVTMIPSDNKKQYFQMTIPQGIRLLKIPDYIQEKYGVYGTGIGCYLKNDFWYIYPLLNHQKFNNTVKTAVIVNVPPRDMLANENSYFEDSDTVTIFTSGDTYHIDQSEKVLNNIGRGFRYAIASNLLDTFCDEDEEGAYIPEKRNRVTINAEESSTGFENITVLPQRLTDNPWLYLSQIAVGLASLLTINWDYANIDLLYPGMPCKLLYKHKKVVQAVHGTLIKIEANTSSKTNLPTDKKYITSAKLTIFCERIKNELTR